MPRALGFHRHGDQIAYALVERAADSPPEVLAAGRCALDDLVALHQRLSAEHHLPWGLAEEREGRRIPAPAPDWPLHRPAARCVAHPALAAAAWEWDLGRIAEEDLFLWLRPERLLWSRGEPGRGHAGVEPRRGPLGESLDRILSRVGGHGAQVALAASGDAPGAATLEKALGRMGCRLRPSKSLPEERGADRAAAGVALGSLDPGRPGFAPPLRVRTREPWLWTASFLAAAAVGGSAWLAREQARAPRAFSAPALPEEIGLPAAVNHAPAPAELEQLLARRRAVMRALETLAAGLPPGSLEEFEVMTAEGSSRAQVRMRLLPREEDGTVPALEDPEGWARSMPAGMQMTARVLEDGSTVIRGEVRPEAADE